MMYPFLPLIGVIARRAGRQTGGGLSAKDAVLATAAGVLAFGGLFLAFWLAARSVLG